MSWNPDQYLKFSAPRLRPAIDLLAHISKSNPEFVYDLGCGAGNVTRLLTERWPQSSITGIDTSESMLQQARAELPQLNWINGSIADWNPPQLGDVVFSNAALHWLPNHATLFPTILSRVRSGGALAVQMPRNFAAPSHTIIADMVRTDRWRNLLEHLLVDEPVATPEFYYRVMTPLSRSVDIWETEYLHVLTGNDPVKEWVKGSWLKQFLDALQPTDASEFEFEYARRLRVAYPPEPNGETLFPFRRLFLIAIRN